MQKIIQRKLRLFGHICRMSNDRKIKTLMFGIMDGPNKRGRPHREWADDIVDWCGASLQELSYSALDRIKMEQYSQEGIGHLAGAEPMVVDDDEPSPLARSVSCCKSAG